jgi:hypothetical protein
VSLIVWWTQILMYFAYTMIFAVFFFVLTGARVRAVLCCARVIACATGSIGFYSALLFVNVIYESVKVD